jgi:hypothetical protein
LEKRIDAIESNWGFWCQCQACLDDEKEDHAARTKLPRIHGAAFESTMTIQQAWAKIASTPEGKRLKAFKDREAGRRVGLGGLSLRDVPAATQIVSEGSTDAKTRTGQDDPGLSGIHRTRLSRRKSGSNEG